MTRPTPTQGAQSEAARVPRVSDERLEGLLLYADYRPADINLCVAAADLTFDLRDARQASRDKDATIADLERRLAEDKRVYESALTKAGQDLQELGSWMFRVAELKRQLAGAKEAHARLSAILDEVLDQRDALKARLTEAEQRAATAERRGFEAGRDAAAGKIVSGYLDSEMRSHAEAFAAEIRALAPAVPQEGETTPGA